MTSAPPEPASDLPLWETGLPVLREGVPSPDWAQAALAGADPAAEGLDPAPPMPAPAPLPGPVEAADLEAARIIALARQQAEDYLQAARREALEALATEQEAALQTVIGLLREDLQAQFAAAWEVLEQEAALLCASLVEPVVRRAVADDDQIVVEAVREGLSRMAGARSMDVRVSPEAVAILEAARPQLAAELPSGVTFTISPEPSIAPGGAVIQSSNGTLDMRIEAQVQRVREATEALIQGGAAPGAEAE